MTPRANKLVVWVAFVAALTAFMVWSVEESMKFSCRPGSHQVMPGDTVFGVALQFCDGDIQNASMAIMEHNGIKREDLGDLRVNQILVIPGS